MSSPIRSSCGRSAAVGEKEIRLFREGEDHLAADLVLVVPEAGMGIDRVEWAQQLVANAVRSPHTREAYLYALEQFFQWAAGRAISRESVQGYVTWLGEVKFSPSTINQRLAAIRKLATEAERCGYVDSETAQAIVTVAGVKQKGRRLGRWLAWEEARTLLQAPNPHSIRGMRDRALLAVLVACALRRGELSRMNCDHLAMRDGRWVFLDFKGKGNKTRSVAVPLWVKQAIDGWLQTAGIEEGPIFRRVSANGRVGEDALTERAVWQLVREYAAQVGIGALAPHDLRRTAAKLCRAKGGELEQIQFLLGHESILTTERYLGSEQDLKNAVNDALVFE
jgi:site-specific recombinase XerD